MRNVRRRNIPSAVRDGIIFRSWVYLVFGNSVVCWRRPFVVTVLATRDLVYGRARSSWKVERSIKHGVVTPFVIRRASHYRHYSQYSPVNVVETGTGAREPRGTMLFPTISCLIRLTINFRDLHTYRSRYFYVRFTRLKQNWDKIDEFMSHPQMIYLFGRLHLMDYI